MTTTYDITTDVGKVRLQIGDTDTGDAVFTDEEIQVYLTIHGSIPLAAADLFEAWAAKYAANADSETIGDYQYKQTMVKKMLSLAKQLRDTLASVPYFTWAEPDYNAIGDPDD